MSFNSDYPLFSIWESTLRTVNCVVHDIRAGKDIHLDILAETTDNTICGISRDDDSHCFRLLSYGHDMKIYLTDGTVGYQYDSSWPTKDIPNLYNEWMLDRWKNHFRPSETPSPEDIVFESIHHPLNDIYISGYVVFPRT